MTHFHQHWSWYKATTLIICTGNTGCTEYQYNMTHFHQLYMVIILSKPLFWWATTHYLYWVYRMSWTLFALDFWHDRWTTCFHFWQSNKFHAFFFWRRWMRISGEQRQRLRQLLEMELYSWRNSLKDPGTLKYKFWVNGIFFYLSTYDIIYMSIIIFMSYLKFSKQYFTKSALN